MILNLLINIFSNLISALVISLCIYAIYSLISLIERRNILRFFGISNEIPRLIFYLSRLQIKKRGTTGFEPLKNGYSGPAISKIEYDGSLLIRQQIMNARFTLIPKNFVERISQQSIKIITLDPVIKVSPQSIQDITLDNIISVGSNVYNLVTKHYLAHPSCLFYFKKNEAGERIIGLKSADGKEEDLQGRSIGRELAIIQKIYDLEHGNVVYLCAGLSGEATFGSVRYLSENWKKLQRKYKDAEFGICLAFPNQSMDVEMVVEPIIIYEKQV